MPEPDDRVDDNTDYKKRFDDTRADNNRLRQEVDRLKALEELVAQEKLVDRDQYSQHIIDWASKEPEKFLAWAGLEDKVSLGSSEARQQAGSGRESYVADDSVFDPTSKTHQEFVRKYGEEALQPLFFQRHKDAILAATGLGDELSELRAAVSQLTEDKTRIEEELKKSNNYSIASWQQMRMMQDPDLARAHKFYEELAADPEKYKAAAKLYYENQEREASSMSKPQAPAPDELLKRQKQAEGIPAGTAPQPGSATSQPRSFDDAVRIAREQLAKAG